MVVKLVLIVDICFRANLYRAPRPSAHLAVFPYPISSFAASWKQARPYPRPKMHVNQLHLLERPSHEWSLSLCG